MCVCGKMVIHFIWTSPPAGKMKEVLAGWFRLEVLWSKHKGACATLTITLERQSEFNLYQEGLKQRYFSEWWGALKYRIMFQKWLCWARNRMFYYIKISIKDWVKEVYRHANPIVVNLSKSTPCHGKHIWKEDMLPVSIKQDTSNVRPHTFLD